MKSKSKLFLMLIGGVNIISLFSTFNLNQKSNLSVFSWYQDQLRQPSSTFSKMNSWGIGTIFQYLSLDESPDDITAFLKSAQANNKKVYFLTGQPEWGLDIQANQIKHFIKEISCYNTTNLPQTPLEGIVIDVEPYLLDEFKVDSKMTMSIFTQSMVEAYKYANQRQLKVIICIPYYFDTMGFNEELEQLIRDASDSIAVMNYYRNKEIQHIETEANLSRRYNKPIITIYELQPADQHTIIDMNTYNQLGVPVVYNNLKQVVNAYKGQDLYGSFHEFKTLVQLTTD